MPECEVLIIPEVREVQVIPSDEEIIVPPDPVAMKILFAYITSKSDHEVPEVREVQEEPSDEVRIVPLCPTTKLQFD